MTRTFRTWQRAVIAVGMLTAVGIVACSGERPTASDNNGDGHNAPMSVQVDSAVGEAFPDSTADSTIVDVLPAVVATAASAADGYTVSPGVTWADGIGGRASIRISSSRPASSSDSIRLTATESWVEIPTAWKRATHTVTARIGVNPSWTKNREQSIRIVTRRRGQNTDRGRVLIRQRPSLDLPALVAKSLTVPAGQSDIVIAVRAAAGITVEAYALDYFVAMASATQPSERGIVARVFANASSAARTARVVVRATRDRQTYDVVDTVRITQAANPGATGVRAVTPATASITADAQQLSLSIDAVAGYDWRATQPVESWARLAGALTGTGSAVRVLQVDANPSSSARVARLSIDTVTVTVTQAGRGGGSGNPVPGPVTVTPTRDTLRVGIDTTALTVTASAGQAWACPTGFPSWLRRAATCPGSGSTVVRLISTANTGAARSAVLSVAGTPVTIVQRAYVAPSVLPGTLTVPALAGNAAVTVTAPAGQPWTTGAPSAAWLRVVSGQSGNGTGVVTFSVSANVTSARRQATVVVAGTTVTVVQLAPGAITVTPTLSEVGRAAGTVSVNVSTAPGQSWTVGATSANWLRASPTGGTGAGAVTLTVSANSGAERRATVVVAGVLVTVVQAGASEPSVSFSTNDLAISAFPSQATVGVRASAPSLPWTMTVGDASWITNPSGEQGIGSASRFLSFSTNGRFARGALIRVATSTGQEDWLSVRQAGTSEGLPTPVLGTSISATAIRLDAGTLTATLQLTAPSGTCWKTGEVPAGWLKVTGAGGVCGSATVTVTSTFNTGRARGSVFHVAGWWVRVMQAGVVGM